MSLSGYIFDNLEDIKPYTSLYNQGEQYEFISKLSKRLKCYGYLGYAEVTQDGKYYNSCFIITPEGESLPSYRKHFLYDDDERWSLEGKDFGYMEITTKKGINLKLGIGICMDINPYKFKSPFGKMEFANHCLNKNVDLIVFPTNWIDNEPNNISESHKKEIWSYWMERMRPYKNLKNNKNVYMLFANRIGKEKKTTFIKCKNGHKFCFVCLKDWHEGKKCDVDDEEGFQIWKKNKIIKQCPKCKMYTEKNEGCNHMTCVECKYQWCWLCCGEYKTGHFSSGKCAGLQFFKPKNEEEIQLAFQGKIQLKVLYLLNIEEMNLYKNFSR